MKTSKHTLLTAIFIAMAFTASCSSGDTNQGKFCIYTTTQECFSTYSDSCPTGGELSDFCPFSTQKSSSSFGNTSGNNSSNSNVIVVGEFTDSRDQKKYKTVVIGTQTWMAENLNCDVSGSVCYGNDPANCVKYGRLYNWATAMNISSSYNSSSYTASANHQGICPSGWHIPSYDDWSKLCDYVGGSSVVGKHLKAKTGWNSCSPSGSSYVCSDTHGFSALPGGNGFSDGYFDNAGNHGYWWSSSETGSNFADYRSMRYNNPGTYWGDFNKTFLVSVRCLQD